jgi:hypothetical protein
MPLRRSLAVLAVAALALVGCGKKTSTSATGGPSRPTATSAVVNVAADQAKARTLLLASSDFPTGWKATPHQRDPSEKAFDDELAACVGRPSPATYTTADIDSPDFSMGNAEAISSAALVRTVEDFKADVAAASGPKYASCVKHGLAKLFPGQLPAGSSLQSVAVEPVPVASYGEFSKGFRATTTVKVQGQSVNTYDDEVLLGKGRIELSASFSNSGRPFDPALKQALLAKLAARLEAA